MTVPHGELPSLTDNLWSAMCYFVHRVGQQSLTFCSLREGASFSMQCSGSLFITLVAVTAVTSRVFSLWAAGQSVNAVLHMQRAVEANKDFFLIPWAYFERTKCKQNQKKINIFYESVYVSVAGRKCTIEGNHKHQMMVNGVEIWVCQTAQKLQGINTWVQLVCRAEHLPTWLHC